MGPLPANEKGRIASLHSYCIFEIKDQKEFDDITRLAAIICQTPVCLINLIDDNELVVKSKLGMEISRASRDTSFCQYTILQDNVYVINDTHQNDLFVDNLFVVNDPKIRFYAGAPLKTSDGFNIGTICVIDYQPRNLTEDQLNALKILADQVTARMELIKKQRELEESKVMMEKFFDAMPVGVFVLKKDQTLYYANKKSASILGKEMEEDLFSKNLVQTYNVKLAGGDAEFPNEKTFLHKALKGEHCYSNDIEIWRDGKAIPVQLWCSPILNDKGEVTYAIGVFDDIAEQKAIENKLKESEGNYRNLIEDIGDVVYTADPYGHFTFINSRINTLVGYTPEELMGKHFTTLIAPQWKEKIKILYLHQFKSKTEETVYEFPIVSKNGNLKWVEQSVRIWWKPNGMIRNFHCMVRDIDTRKQTEAALIQAKQIAEEAKKVQEIFLANMSHEIRTPMNGVLGIANLLAETTLSQKQKEYVAAILQSGNGLMVIINDILDLTKIQSGKIILEKLPFDLRETIDNMMYALKKKAEDKGLNLITEIDSDIPSYILGDPTRLVQILTNLTGNAIKFTENGFVKIKISLATAKDEENDLHLTFEIEDSGIGIPKEKLSTIFENFTQASSDTTRKFGGTGLGLSISKQLIEMQNGNISVKSKLGKGSLFTFSIPYKKAKKPTENSPSAEDGNRKTLEGIRIILAEDNSINQLVALDTLARWKANVELAENGVEVLAKLRQNTYDLILMDLQMPEMGGEECTEIIRRGIDQSIAKIPIIAMTASAFKKEKEKCFKIGMNGYVSKPFFPEELFKEISDVLAAQAKNIAILKST